MPAPSFAVFGGRCSTSRPWQRCDDLLDVRALTGRVRGSTLYRGFLWPRKTSHRADGGIDMPKTSLTLGLAFSLALAALVTPAPAQTPGLTAKEIKLGNISPYSGPASAYASIGKSTEAYFKKVNDEGGINGRKINFITYDDAYSPPRAVEMVRKLVEQDQVLFVLEPVGTPSNSAIHKYMNHKKVPQLFVATGATKWGDPKNFPWTMGWQPPYQGEARVYAQYILKSLPDAKVGILYQNDDFGKDYVKGFKDALGAAAKKIIVLEQSYEVSDPVVDSQIVNLKNSGANVFFNIVTTKAGTQAIKKAHDIGWKPTHFLSTTATSVGTVLKPAGLDASKGLITALYGKDPTDPQWKNDPGYKEWVAFMKKYYPDGDMQDWFAVYGYLVAQTAMQVLKQCGNDLSRENIMRQAANLKDVALPMLLPGVKINTSPTDFYPIEQMQLAKFDGERWVLFGEVFDSSTK
jgi:branched-chain amino acid transport system substrate-binding protein